MPATSMLASLSTVHWRTLGRLAWRSTPDPTVRVIVPPPDRHQILSFLYDHPTIGATPYRTIDLPPDLSPPAAIVPEGLLWAISDLGHLVAWDLSPGPPGATFDIGDALIDLDLAAATPGGALTVSSFEIYPPPVGEGPDLEDPPIEPIDPPVDHVYALVGAEEGLFLFRIHLTDAHLETSILRVNIEEAAFNGEVTLEAERYTVLSSTMPSTLSLTPTLGVVTPRPSPLSDEGAPPGGIQFLTFSTGARAFLPAGAATFTFTTFSDGSGNIDFGSFIFPLISTVDTGGAAITYSGVPVQVRFESYTLDPVAGSVDAAHDDAIIKFGGRLRFRPSMAVSGFGACFTPEFQVDTVHTGTSPPPGTNYLGQLDLSGDVMVPGNVPVTGSCNAAAAAAINSLFGLSSSATFDVWKATLTPEIEGSY